MYVYMYALGHECLVESNNFMYVCMYVCMYVLGHECLVESNNFMYVCMYICMHWVMSVW